MTAMGKKLFYLLIFGLTTIFIVFPEIIQAVTTYTDIVPLGPTNGLFGGAGRIYIHPLEDDVLYASGNDTFMLSLDGGLNWMPIYKFKSSYYYRWEIDPHVPSRSYIVDNNHIYRSDDFGRNWIDKTPPNTTPDDITVSPSQPNIVYLRDGSNLYISTDYGETWQLLSVKERAFLYNMSIYSVTVDRFNPYKLYIDGSLSSSYGGSGYKLYIYTLDLKNPANDNFIVGGNGLNFVPEILRQDELNPSTIWVFRDYYSCLYKSEDGGVNFQVNSVSFCSEYIREVISKGTNLVVATNNGIKFSNDGGKSFSLIVGDNILSVSTINFIKYAYFVPYGCCYATIKVYDGANLFSYGPVNITGLSNDARYASSIYTIYKEDSSYYKDFDSFGYGIEKLEAFLSGNLFLRKSSDCYMLSSDKRLSGYISCYSFYLPELSKEEVYITRWNGIFLLSLDYTNMTATINKAINTSITDATNIAVSTDRTKIAINRGYSIYVSSDSGKNFSKTAITDSKGINKIIIDRWNGNNIFVAGGSGLYFSNNGGLTFMQKLSGNVKDIKQIDTNNYIAVVDTNLFETEDGGSTWLNIPLPYPYYVNTATKVGNDYILGTDFGVVKYKGIFYGLSVLRLGTGSGTVTSNPAGINCGTDCTEAYSSGTVVTLTASAANGSTFGGWGGACSGCGTNQICQVTMNTDKNCVSTFNIATPNITVIPASRNFGTVNIGNSASQIFSVSNTGSGVLSIGQISLTGSDASQFILQNDNCSFKTIAPSGNCTLEAFFTPLSLLPSSAKTGIIQIPSNDPDQTVLNISLSGIAALCSINFADIPTGYWAESFIKTLYCNGITSGCTTSPLQYCPDGNVTRAQMAVFIIRALLGNNFTYQQTPYFTDIPSSHWAFKYIQKMKELNITSGCTANTYCPDAPVTRAQMAVFITKALGQSPSATCTGTVFNDVNASTVGDGFCRYIEKFATLGITSGCGNGNYCPSDTVTRAQMAVFLTKGFLQ